MRDVLLGTLISIGACVFMFVLTRGAGQKNPNLFCIPWALYMLPSLFPFSTYNALTLIFALLPFALAFYVFKDRKQRLISYYVAGLFRILILPLILSLVLDGRITPLIEFLGSVLGGGLFCATGLFILLALYPDPDKGQKERTPVLLEQKSIGMCILLTIVTGFIFGVYWRYSILQKIRLISEESPNCGKELCLTIFVPFYWLYYVYTRSRKLVESAGRCGVALKDNSTLHLVLCIFGLGIVTTALIQDQLNTAAKAFANAENS